MNTSWLNDVSWFAVQAKRYRESLGAASVSALGLEVFLPLVRVDWGPETVIKVESKPLFAGYFFARFCPALSLKAVESACGVLYVVKAGSNPMPVEEEIIWEIKDRVSEDGLIRLDRCKLKPGDRVAIQRGPFAGMMGRVEAELDDRKRVAIFLEALWQARILLNRSCVEMA